MESLTTAIRGLTGDNHLATTGNLHKACIAFFGIDETSIEMAPNEEAFFLRKHHVLLAGLGRAKGLIDSAIEWSEPAIARDADTSSGVIRGVLWRYVIAYSGWELLSKTVQWNGKKVYKSFHPAFDRLLEPSHHLKPPHPSSDSAPEALTSWLSGDHVKHERNMPTFLGLSKPLQPFPRWLVGNADSLSNQQVMAAMRHIVAHGVLSPTKASQWGLEDLYRQGPAHVETLTCCLMDELTAGLP